MNQMHMVVSFVLLTLASGCATFPEGPSVRVLPGQGKHFEQFQAEDATCRQWAERQAGIPAQQSYDDKTATGAVAGTAVGAGVGAALGAASRHPGAGAIFGAATGLLFGSAIGSSEGEISGRQLQRRYDNAYLQCMYSYGNQIPGVRQANSRVPALTPPPPPGVPAPAPPAAVAPVPVDLTPVPPGAVMPAPPVAGMPAPAVGVQPPPVVAVGPPPVAGPQVDYYPPPPQVYFQEPPQFLYSPSMDMYVAVGVPYDLVYTGNEYLYFYRGRWYRSPYCNGPWIYAPRRAYAGYYGYRVDRIRRFREREYARYRRDRGHYDGRLHHARFR